MTEEEIISTIRKQKGSCEGIFCHSYDEETNTAFLCPLYNMCDFTTCEQRLEYLNKHYPEYSPVVDKQEFVPGDVYADEKNSLFVLCTKSNGKNTNTFAGYPIGKYSWNYWRYDDNDIKKYIMNAWDKKAFHHVTMEVKDDTI